MTREEKAKDIASSFSMSDYTVAYEAALEMAEWKDQNPANPWHDASKELPKENGKYLVKAFNGYLCALSFIDGDWKTFGYQSDVKYWMPIPELPKED